MSHIILSPGFKPATEVTKERFMSREERVVRKEIDTLVYDLVSEYSKFDQGYEIDFYDIPEDERNQLIALMLEADGNSFYAIGENDDKHIADILAGMINLIRKDDSESEYDFAETVKKAIHAYYREQAQELLNDMASDVTRWWMEEHGLRYGMHADNGELYITK